MSVQRRSESERHFDALVGRNIMLARKARRISGVRLAAFVGIDFRRLYWIETGGRCSLFLALQISAALGVSLGGLTSDAMPDEHLKAYGFAIN